MQTLRDLQRGFRRALLERDEAALDQLILEDGLPTAERLAVYRNNVVSSLTTALKDVFPAVCRLVDERFFDYAAHAFLTARPPERPCLAEYGAGFADFLAGFPPCRELVYLPDVARLEWLIHAAAHAADAVPATPTALHGFAPGDTPRLTFRFQPSLALIASPWPIDRIWGANKPDGVAEEAIDIDAGGATLEVRRRDSEIAVRALPAANFAFRRVLHGGGQLEAAAEAAFAEDGDFDLARALVELFSDGLVLGVVLAPPTAGETTS
jgi:hypothetical protein